MSPLGPYKDFADCVAKNGDKDSPQAFCAFLHKRVTGKYPSENSEPNSLSEKDQRAIDTMFDEPPKAVIGIEAFRIGAHTDSRGVRDTYTTDDLRKMKAAFEAGVPPMVPVKLGHTSEEFLAKVSEELGLPTSLLSGDETGKGAAKLGEVIAVKPQGDRLMVDITTTEGKLAELVERGFFNGVSLEIQKEREQDGKTWERVISGIALLGAERPAIPGLAPLQKATLLSDGSKADSILCFYAEPYTRSEDYTEGSAVAPSSDASDGAPGGKMWEVPLTDAVRGRRIFATVSAADEVSAKKVALRGAENFLLSAGGPLGTIIGGAMGAIIATRLVAGKPILKLGGIKGLFKWRFAADDPIVELLAESNYSLLPDTAMNRVQHIWDSFESGNIDRDEAVRRIENVVRQVEGQVPENVFQKLMSAIQLIKSGLMGRREPGEVTAALAAMLAEMAEHGQEFFFKIIRPGDDESGKDSEIISVKASSQEEAKEKVKKSLESRAIKDARIIATKAFVEHAPSGVSPEAWTKCLADARSAGVENPEAHCRTKFQEQMEEHMKGQLAKLLNMAEDVKEEDLIKAFTAKLGEIGTLTAELVTLKSEMAELKKEPNAAFAEVTGRVTSLEAQNKGLLRDKRAAEYRESVVNVKAIEGTPAEMAERLMKVEGTAGKEAAEALLSEWQKLDKAYQDHGLLTTTLSPGRNGDTKHEFTERVEKLCTEKGWDPKNPQLWAQAFTITADSDRGLFSEYMKAGEELKA